MNKKRTIIYRLNYLIESNRLDKWPNKILVKKRIRLSWLNRNLRSFNNLINLIL